MRGTMARRFRGMTLVELMLAMASTAMIGLAISAMLAAVAYGTQGGKDARTLVVKAKTINSRLSASVRRSALVLACNDASQDGDDFLVLWTPGPDVDGSAPRTSELHRIEFHGPTGQVRSYRNPSPGADTTYNLATDDFNAVTQSLISGGTLPVEIWATGVEALQLRLDVAAAREAKLISYRFTLRAGDLAEVVACAAALRNRSIASGG